MKWMSRPCISAAVATLLLAGALGGGASAQEARDLDAGLLFATRAQLEAMLAKAQEASNATGYSAAIRDIADDEADLIRYRLEQGDFEVGDLITVTVSGAPTTGATTGTTGAGSLSNSYTVAPGKLLIFPGIPEMSLHGLLRSELAGAVQDHLLKFYRDVKVFVSTSIRLQVSGEVGQPGFHVVNADQRFPDMLAGVGQPSRAANMDKIRIKRKDETIWDGDELQLALIEGRTLDQLSLRAGDVIEVPAQSKTNFFTTIRSITFVVPLSLAIWRLSRIF